MARHTKAGTATQADATGSAQNGPKAAASGPTASASAPAEPPASGPSPDTLESRVAELEAENARLRARFQEVENEFASLANLFIASSHLHSTLSPRTVTRRIKEVMGQLVGAERYCMYLADADGKELVPVASEGVAADQLVPLRVDGSRCGRVYRSGSPVIRDAVDTSRGTFEDPPAMVPLFVEGKVVGVMAIFTTLAQKTCFERTDLDLLQLLGQHAASALVSASLFVQADRKLPGLEAFLDLSV